jgi:hypothetical protein
MTTTYPRRIAGVLAQETGETRHCPRCAQDQPVVKTVTRHNGNDYVGLWCSFCEKELTCYPVVKAAKSEDGDGQPVKLARTDKHTDASPMPFGKAHGPQSANPKKLKDVPDNYLAFLRDQPWINEWSGLKHYIDDRLNG